MFFRTYNIVACRVLSAMTIHMGTTSSKNRATETTRCCAAYLLKYRITCSGLKRFSVRIINERYNVLLCVVLQRARTLCSLGLWIIEKSIAAYTTERTCVRPKFRPEIVNIAIIVSNSLLDPAQHSTVSDCKCLTTLLSQLIAASLYSLFCVHHTYKYSVTSSNVPRPYFCHSAVVVVIKNRYSRASPTKNHQCLGPGRRNLRQS